MTSDIIIIGGGLGGLECALLLAQQGRTVTVLEREVQPGGAMQSYRRKGMEWDTGFHYVGGIGEGQPLHEPFRRLGLLDLPWVRLDEDCFDRIHIGGRSYDFAQGYDRFADTLAEKFPSEATGLREYVEMLRESSRHQFDSLGNDGQDGLMDSANGKAFATSAWQWLHEHIHDERLINVLSGNALRFELRRETLPLFTFAHLNSSFIQGSWRLRGSGQLIAVRLVEGIRALGGKVICNAEVTRLVEEDGHITAAECANGDVYGGNVFVSDLHPKLTYGLIDKGKRIRKGLRQRMEMMENTYGMLTTSLLLKPDALPYANHNDYIYAKDNLWQGLENAPQVEAVLVSYRVPEDGSTFTRQIDLMTPVGWDECRQWAGTAVGRRGEEYKAWKRQKADECVRLAATIVPDLESIVEDVFVSSPLTWRDYTLTPCGSAYGLRKDCTSPLLTFLTPRTPEPNLYLTGQSLFLHGVEGVTMTALLTCKEIAKQ